MIGEHVLTLHETNQGNFLPVCSCGHLGYIEITPRDRDERTKRLKRYPNMAKEAATAQHADHVQRCARPLVDRMNP